MPKNFISVLFDIIKYSKSTKLVIACHARWDFQVVGHYIADQYFQVVQGGPKVCYLLVELIQHLMYGKLSLLCF